MSRNSPRKRKTEEQIDFGSSDDYSPTFSSGGLLLSVENLPCVKRDCQDVKYPKEGLTRRKIIMPHSMRKYFALPDECEDGWKLLLCLRHFKPRFHSALTFGEIVPNEKYLFLSSLSNTQTKVKAPATLKATSDILQSLKPPVKPDEPKKKSCEPKKKPASSAVRKKAAALAEANPQPSCSNHQQQKQAFPTCSVEALNLQQNFSNHQQQQAFQSYPAEVLNPQPSTSKANVLLAEEFYSQIGGGCGTSVNSGYIDLLSLPAPNCKPTSRAAELDQIIEEFEEYQQSERAEESRSNNRRNSSQISHEQLPSYHHQQENRADQENQQMPLLPPPALFQNPAATPSSSVIHVEQPHRLEAQQLQTSSNVTIGEYLKLLGV